MLSKLFAIAIVILVTSSCTTVTRQSDVPVGSFGPIASVSIGDSRASVIKKLGSPCSENSEKFPANEYEVLEYSKENGVPTGYISLDRDSGKVAGRAIWVSETQPEQEFSHLQSQMFPKSTFETFITCDKHHADEVKVDRGNGIFVGMHREHVILVTWSDPKLTRLRIEQFGIKCPERQTRP